MAKVKFQIKGNQQIAKKLATKANARQEVEDITENSMKRIQMGAFKKAPVLTGFLSSNMAAPENRINASTSKQIQQQLIDNTDYTLVQEFEHASKSAFIRNSVREERDKYIGDLRKWAKKE